MAHFAQLDENNIVLQVIVVNNTELLVEGVEDEVAGINFCRSLFGANTNWKQTSYNGTIRKNYAGPGFAYDEDRDAFVPPKPFDSWTLNEDTCRWEAPVAYPTDNRLYDWNETTLTWVQA